MSFWEILLIGIGLSMDAFAVAVCKGLKMPKLNLWQGLVIGLFFGGFQALMPMLGWLLGSTFEQYITRLDHWVAFGLLSVIGIKMIWDSFHPEKEEPEASAFDIKELLLMAVATSIDALAVGIAFAVVSVNIVSSAAIIGCTTFLLSLIGVVIGRFFGAKLQGKAEGFGGAILFLIGLKILLEHLGVLAF